MKGESRGESNNRMSNKEENVGTRLNIQLATCASVPYREINQVKGKGKRESMHSRKES